MNIEEAEDIYRQELESAEKEFVEGFKSKGDVRELEKIYKSKLKASREKYYNLISGELKKKDFKSKSKKFRSKEKKQKPFEVEEGNFELGLFQKLRYKSGLRGFKFWFGIRNFLRKKTPDIVFYSYFKLKLKTKRFLSMISNLFEKFVKKIEEIFRVAFEKTKSGLKKVYKKTMELPGKITGKLSRKKKSEGKENSGKSSEEQKSEDKISSDQNK